MPVTTVSAEETGWISGTVTEGYSTKLLGVTVSVTGKTTTATTDASGKYNLSLPVGTYDLKFTKTNYKDYVKSSVTVQANKTTTASVNMEKAKGGIHGKVTDKSTGKGIYMATVAYGTGILDDVSTGSDGTYKIDGLSVGTYYLNVTTYSGYKPSTTTRVTVTANTNTTQDFQLEPIPVHLLVTVSDGGLFGLPTEKAISGATVTLDDKTLTTGADGTANFTNLQKRKYNITIKAKNFKTFTAKNTDIGAPDMSTGSYSYKVGLVSNKASNDLFGAALLCILIPVIIVIIVIVLIVVIIMVLRKKKQPPVQAPPQGYPPQQPYAAPPPTAPQQPQTYEQMYGTPPPQQPQQGYSQPPVPPGQQYQGYSPPPAPPGQQGQYQQPPPPY